jgi:hypothetical protein
MSDLKTLGAAFAELERRADEAPPTFTFDLSARRHRSRLPLVAAAAAGVLAIAGGAAVLARSGGSDAAHTAAGGATAPAARTPTGSAAVSSSVSSSGVVVPATAAELEQRFTQVLAGSAMFTVTDTGAAVPITLPARHGAGGNAGSTPAKATVSNGSGIGAAIVGTLTAGGVTGGFDLQILQNRVGMRASCDSPEHCSVSRLADGSTLALGRVGLDGGGTTYQADLVYRDGVEVLMHVSSQRSPKGGSAVVSPEPPLTRQQMAAIVTSDRW